MGSIVRTSGNSPAEALVTVLEPSRKERSFMPDATAVTQETFDQEVLSSDTPVLVDFWAEWCQPCHMVSPILDKIVEERPGQLRLVKINIDEQPALAQRYGVASIPTMILFKDGEPAAAALGAQPKGALERQLGLEPVTA
jgi:thioredoxin 1